MVPSSFDDGPQAARKAVASIAVLINNIVFFIIVRFLSRLSKCKKHIPKKQTIMAFSSYI